MKNEGKKFEEDIKKSIPDDCYYYRIKDTMSYGNDNSFARFTPKNEFDMMIFKQPLLLLLELKSTKSISMPYDMIKDHQIEELNKGSMITGVVAGFLLNIRISNTTYFLNIKDFIKFKNESTKKSINVIDVHKHKGILIKQTLLRTRFRYDIETLINQLTF